MDKRIDCNYGCPLFQVEVDNCCEKYCSDMADYKEEVRTDVIDECIAKIDILEQISFGIVEVDLVKDLLEKLKEDKDANRNSND